MADSKSILSDEVKEIVHGASQFGFEDAKQPKSPLIKPRTDTANGHIFDHESPVPPKSTLSMQFPTFQKKPGDRSESKRKSSCSHSPSPRAMSMQKLYPQIRAVQFNEEVE